MRAALIIALLLASHRLSDACQPVFDPSVVARPLSDPADAVTISSEQVDVDCDDRACTVEAHYAITVGAPARVTATGKRTSETTLGTARAAPASAIEVAPGDTELTMRTRVELWSYIDDCFRDGVVARHPWLGSGTRREQRVVRIATTAVPRVHHPASWHVVVDRRPAERDEPAATWLWFAGPPRRFVHGGLVALIGVASGEGRLVRFRGGWEAAIGWPSLVFAITADSDAAAAWNVALTAETTSRAWILPLSLGAGGGAVLAGGTRPGGRAQVSIAVGPVRLLLSTDVLAPSGASGVDAAVAALVGGSI